MKELFKFTGKQRGGLQIWIRGEVRSLHYWSSTSFQAYSWPHIDKVLRISEYGIQAIIDTSLFGSNCGERIP